MSSRVPERPHDLARGGEKGVPRGDPLSEKEKLYAGAVLLGRWILRDVSASDESAQVAVAQSLGDAERAREVGHAERLFARREGLEDFERGAHRAHLPVAVSRRDTSFRSRKRCITEPPRILNRGSPDGRSMKMHAIPCTATALAFSLSQPFIANAAKLEVWTARAFATVLAEIGPRFEQETGHTLKVSSGLPS